MNNRHFIIAALLVAALLPEASALEPSNPDASPEARALLEYLSQLREREDRKVISGQVAGYPWRDTLWQIEQVHRNTGHWVGIIHTDLRSVVRDFDWDAALNRLIDHWHRGGLVSAGVHWHNPRGGYQSNSRPPHPDLEQVITPGKPQHDSFKRQADEVAARLEHFQRAGVPVIFVPFNECTLKTKIKWWAGQDPEQFRRMYRWLHDYYTRVKKLNNLLWVYNTARMEPGMEYDTLSMYPGDSYVDISGPNHQERMCDTHEVAYYKDEYEAHVSTGKVVGFPEGMNFGLCEDFDFTRVIQAIKKFYPAATYFVCYNTFYSGGRKRWHRCSLHEPGRNAKGLLDDPWILNREDLAREFLPHRVRLPSP